MKKLFIKICKILGFEIIDQNKFSVPTLDKEINQDLSKFNEKSIILPLGEVKITRKVNSIILIVRVNTNVEIWDQNKKRLFEQPKIEYSKRSIKSLITSIDYCKKKHPNLNVKTLIVDDHSSPQNLKRIKEITDKKDVQIISLDHKKFETIIKNQKSNETFSNLASLLQSFEIGKNEGNDLILFLEDDYLHFESMLDEMILTYERVASQVGRDILMCPTDYPYLYMNNEKTNILIGNKRHWRTVNKTLCTFLISKSLIEKYWENLHKTCVDRHDPFEKYINEIYKNEICISPIKSLSLHLTNVNSSYGLAPFIDYKKLWDQNE
tara:strand:- start:177 stop:1145 length:969 start_codon:yes stop_codon:yes gene_type:complete